MPGSGREHHVPWLCTQRLEVCERVADGRRNREDAPIGCDPQKRACNAVDDRVRRPRREDALEPRPRYLEVGMIVAVSREDHVHVE